MFQLGKKIFKNPKCVLFIKFLQFFCGVGGRRVQKFQEMDILFSMLQSILH